MCCTSSELGRLAPRPSPPSSTRTSPAPPTRQPNIRAQAAASHDSSACVLSPFERAGAARHQRPLCGDKRTELIPTKTRPLLNSILETWYVLNSLPLTRWQGCGVAVCNSMLFGKCSLRSRTTIPAHPIRLCWRSEKTCSRTHCNPKSCKASLCLRVVRLASITLIDFAPQSGTKHTLQLSANLRLLTTFGRALLSALTRQTPDLRLLAGRRRTSRPMLGY